MYVPADRVVEEAERLGVTSSEVKGAEDKELTRESRGLQALLDGVRAMNDPDDQAKRQASVPILNALYAFRRTRVGAERSA